MGNSKGIVKRFMIETIRSQDFYRNKISYTPIKKGVIFMIIVIRTHDEQWLPLVHPEIKELYEISNYGRIRNIKRGKILSQYKDKKTGYMYVALHVKHKKGNKVFSVHRLVALTFVPNPKNLPIVNHLDSDRTHNYFENLEWTSQSENVIHSIKHGNWYIRGCATKINYSDELVHSICEMMQDGKTNSEIANKLKQEDIPRKGFLDYLGRIRRKTVRENITNQYKW